MKFYYIEPETAGGLGENTVFDRKPGQAAVVHKLHYQFDGWLGDELLESTPCFVVSERMARSIEVARLTGVSFDEVEITKSSQFDELYSGRTLPAFVWLKANGKAGGDDFGIAQDLRLVLSERALGVAQQYGVSHAILSPFDEN